MEGPKFPKNERERLRAVRNYDILDTEKEADFDQIVELASFIAGTPISTITLIDENRQWFKSRIGLDDHETPREVSFCGHAILDKDIMIVNDASRDRRFSDNPYVTGKPDIRFYAGMPLTTGEGYSLGTLCVIDSVPRTLTKEQIKALGMLRDQVLNLFELRKANLELKRSRELQERLISIIGHDLRAPMNAILGVVLLAEKYNLPPDELKESLFHIRKRVADANTLLLNLLEWAKNNIEKGSLKTLAINLKTVVEEVIDPIKTSFEEKNNRIEIQMSEDDYVYAVKNFISFAIRNLLMNANKFTAKGKISVTSRKAPDSIMLEISDTGVGIDTEKIGHLFAWGKHNSTKGTNGEMGSGLGLPMTKEFIETIGGSMSCRSSSGGTVFTLELPRAWDS